MQVQLANRRELSWGEEAAGTPGTPATVLFDGTDSRAYIYDAKFATEFGVFDRRPQRKTLSQLGALIGTLSASITFRVEVKRHATSISVDEWFSFLKACALAEDTAGPGNVKFTPNSTPTTYTTLTMWLNLDGVRLGIAGAMGNVVFNATVGEPMFAEFTFSGVYQGAVDQAISDIDTPETTAPNVFQGVNLQYGGASYCFASLSLNMNNEVSARMCANNAAGIQSYIVTGRRPTVTWDPEMQLAATEDWYDNFKDAVIKAVTFTNGTGSDVAWSLPQVQIIGASDDDRDGISTVGLEGLLLANSEAGDDELEITFT